MKKQATRPIRFTPVERELVRTLALNSVVNIKKVSKAAIDALLFSDPAMRGDIMMGQIFSDLNIETIAQITTVKNKIFNTLISIEVGDEIKPAYSGPLYRFLNNAVSGANEEKGLARVKLYLNPGVGIRDIYINSEELFVAIQIILSHEISHIKDVIRQSETDIHGAMDKAKTEEERIDLFKKYINAPSEFKSRLKEIIVQLDYIINQDKMRYLSIFWNNTPSGRAVMIDKVLAQSPAWTTNEDIFTEESKKKVRKTIYQYFLDELNEARSN